MADPVIAKQVDTASKPQAGDCHGATISVDITWHIEPNVWFEVEALASVDGGQTYSLTLGKCGRWGGVSLSPTTGKPLTEMTLQTSHSNPICKDPLIKIVSRTSKGDAILPAPVFSGVAAVAVAVDPALDVPV